MKRSQLFWLVIACCLFPLSLSLSAAYALDKAYISAAGMPKCMTPGQTATSSVTVVNQGDTTWSSNPAAPVAGCSNADNCPVRLSYHLTGPVNVANGLRTDMPGTVDPQKSQTVSAQIKASDTYGTEAPLPLGKYTLSWQMVREHIGWIEAVTSYEIDVKNNCDLAGKFSLADLCRRVGCGSALIAPHITDITQKPLTQGQLVIIKGKFFGDTPGAVTMKGTFGRNKGGGFVGLAPSSIDLPIVEGLWLDGAILAGPVPADLVGYDQEVEIQVKTKAGSTGKLKAQFATLLEYKLFPRNKMQATCSQAGDSENFCNNYPYGYFTNTVVGYHGGADNVAGADTWWAALKKGWRYHDMVGGSWDGPLNADPRYSLEDGGDKFRFSVAFTIPGTPHSHSSGEFIAASGVGYWINIIVKGPVGMNP